MYGIMGKMRALPGQRAALAAILLEGTAAMPGCLSYVVAADAVDPDALWITEVWDSKENHSASLKLPAVQQAITKGRPLIAGFGERFETRPLGGVGLRAQSVMRRTSTAAIKSPKAAQADDCATLAQLPNVGPAMVRDLQLLGIHHPAELKRRDALQLYRELERRTGQRQDPCVLDTFMAIVDFMRGAPPRPWWHYTAERKRAYGSSVVAGALA